MKVLSEMTDQELLAKYHKLCDEFDADWNSDKSIEYINDCYEKYKTELCEITEECSNRNVTIEQDQEGEIYIQRHF